jgi:hypothetical protein
MKYIVRFCSFWYDFIVGDEPILAIGVIGSVAVSLLLHVAGWHGWWALSAGVIATLLLSLARATSGPR